MLGLVTHEPHFSLLREEIKFGKSVKKQTNPESITFHLLHLSVLREYLDHEFASLKVSCLYSCLYSSFVPFVSTEYTIAFLL